MAEQLQEQYFEFIEPPNDIFQWYILFAANGKEIRIRDRILRIPNAKDKVRQIWIPTINKLVQGKVKKQVMQEVLVSGYIFLLLDLDYDFFRKIMELEDSFYFLWMRGLYSKELPSPVPYEQVKIMETGVNKIKQDLLTPVSKFKERDYVRITTGIFKNLKGYVKELRKNRVILDLEDDVIHRKLAIAVNIDSVEKII